MKSYLIILFIFINLISCSHKDEPLGFFPPDEAMACSIDMYPTTTVEINVGVMNISHDLVSMFYDGNTRCLIYKNIKIKLSSQIIDQIQRETENYSVQVYKPWFQSRYIKFKNSKINLPDGIKINDITQAIKYRNGILFSGNAWRSHDPKLYWIIGYFPIESRFAQVEFCTAAVSEGRLYLVNKSLFR